jgi:hypothetical protein
MAQPPKKPKPPNSKYSGGPPPKVKPNMPQPKNLTPPNATGIKATKPKAKKANGRVSAGSGKNGMYW